MELDECYITTIAYFTAFRLPWAIDTSFVMLVFYATGIWYQSARDGLFDLEKLSITRKVVALVIAFVISLICFAINGGSNIRLLEFGFPVFFLLGAFSGIAMLVVISMLLVGILKKKKWIYEKLLYLGKKTIIILYLHRWFDGIDKLLIIPVLGIGKQTMILYCWYLLMVFSS